MSLNNIHLQDAVVTELYRDLLLESSYTTSAPTPSAPAVAKPATPAAAAPAPATPVSTPTAPSVPRQSTARPGSQQAPKSPAPSGYKFLGNHRRKVSIIVNAPDAPFLPDDQLNVLTRMLEACKMNMGDVAIVNHAAAPVVIGQLKQQLQPSFVLLFGPTPPEIGLPMDFPLFKIQAYDQCTYLTAPSLADMVRPGEESRLLKTRLWGCLKTLFEI